MNDLNLQSELDGRVREILEQYLSNRNNSVSGANFSHLLRELENINQIWLVKVESYNEKVFERVV